MKKIALAVFLIFTTSSAWALSSYAIEGVWGIKESHNGISFDVTFSFHNNSLTLTNVCSISGESVAAQVTVPVIYDEFTVTVLRGAQDQKSTPNHSVNCDVSVQPETINYVVLGNQLIFTQNGSDSSFTLERRGN